MFIAEPVKIAAHNIFEFVVYKYLGRLVLIASRAVKIAY